MAATKNLTNRTVHVHDKDGNVHMIPPGSPFPEWATPQIKSQPLVTQYVNRPLDPDLDVEALAGANAGKPIDPRSRPRGITVTGMAGFGTPIHLDRSTPQQPNVYDLDDENREARYQDELAALKAKYRRPTQEEQARATTEAARRASEPHKFDSLLWGPAEAERKRQAEAARCKAIDE
ncbi:hypothetical protein A5697_20280 [Mycobacterium sp. E3251]|uniref:hypothetical protein n=1 Tax=Mycobacterium sp. E3251 TaxID=1834144 RepID=UPI0007FDB616|nr:hypothetical protein [Mycobacterium sp. E3251]OBG96898.1 hypothetical protein A5697_20280 [Mycobacterium sp. E3251]